MMKMLRKIGIEGNFLDSIKSTHKKKNPTVKLY